LCERRIDGSQLEIYEESDRELLIYSNCSRCGVGMVARLMLVPHGLTGVGILTDVRREELSHMRAQLPVSAEDVLTIKLMADTGHLEIKAY